VQIPDSTLVEEGFVRLRLSMSALAGDPDPNPQVFNFLIAILGSTPVSTTR
jgi:hypothetical protein